MTRLASSAGRGAATVDGQTLAAVGVSVVVAVVIGILCATGRGGVAVLVALALPLLAVVRVALAASPVWLLAASALVTGTLGPIASNPLISSPVHVYLPDVFVAGLVPSLLRRTGPEGSSNRDLTRLSVVYLAFVVTLVVGSIEGHERFHASFVSSPERLALYGLVILVTLRLPFGDLIAKLRLASYLVTVAFSILGTVYIAIGKAATAASVLDTGGERYLGGGVAPYAAAGMIFAALELGRSPGRRNAYTALAILGLGGYVEVLSLQRATLIPLIIALPILIFLGNPRGGRIALIAVVVCAVAGATLVGLRVRAPSQVTTAAQRISGTSFANSDAQSRELAGKAMLAVLPGHELLGAGFGYQPYFFDNQTLVQVEGGDPHDGFIYLLVGGGLACLLAFALLLLTTGLTYVQALIASTPGTRFGLLWGGSMLLVYVANVALGPIISQAEFLATLWLLVALPYAALAEDRRIAERTPQHRQSAVAPDISHSPGVTGGKASPTVGHRGATMATSRFR